MVRWQNVRRAGWLVLLLGGCAASQPDPEAQARQQEALDQILSQPLDPDAYGNPRRCISRASYRHVEPVGDRFLVFEGPGERLWLNELRGRCPGLRRSSTLAFELHGNQICELDQVRIVDWFVLSRFRRAPWDWLEGIPCTLGEFRPVSAEQVQAIRAMLEAD